MTIFAIDFDGTCVEHKFPDVGKDIGAASVLKRLVENGHNLILYTMRSGINLPPAIEWFKINDIPLYAVQENPTQKTWTNSPKCYAQVYIDDAALGIPLKKSQNTRSYVDWGVVADLLEEQGYFA